MSVNTNFAWVGLVTFNKSLGGATSILFDLFVVKLNKGFAPSPSTTLAGLLWCLTSVTSWASQMQTTYLCV